MSDDSDNDLFGDLSGSDDDTDELLNASKGKPIAKKKASAPVKKKVTKKKKEVSIPGEFHWWLVVE